VRKRSHVFNYTTQDFPVRTEGKTQILIEDSRLWIGFLPHHRNARCRSLPVSSYRNTELFIGISDSDLFSPALGYAQI
jgi:hypothetical protein